MSRLAHASELSGVVHCQHLATLRLQKLFFWWCAIGLATCASNALGFSYRLEGTAHFKEWSRPSTNREMIQLASELQIHFQVVVSNQVWRIDVRHPNGTMDVVATDGACIYSTLRGPSNNVLGSVNRGTDPSSLAWPQPLFVWLALASGSFLEAHASPVWPPWIVPDKEMANPYRMEIERGVKAPSLPVSVTILEKVMQPKSEKRAQDRLSKQAMAKEEFIAAKYRVLGSTNVSGLELPLRFELQRYVDDPLRGSPDSPLHFESYEGVVSRVSVETEAVAMPGIALGSPVYDVRFADPKLGVKSIYYELFTEGWPAGDDPVLLQKAQATYAAATRSQHSQRMDRLFANLLTLGLFALCTLSIAAVVWRLTRARGRTTNNQKGIA